MKPMLHSVLVFGGTWLATTFLVSAVGALAVLGPSWLQAMIDLVFASIGSVISTLLFASLLGLLKRVRIPRLFRNPEDGWRLIFYFSAIVLALAEAYILYPLSLFAWSGHDYETIQQIGQRKFEIGVFVGTISGPIGCFVGTIAAWQARKASLSKLSAVTI